MQKRIHIESPKLLIYLFGKRESQINPLEYSLMYDISEKKKKRKGYVRYKVEGSLIDGGPEDPTKRKKEKESRKQLYREYGGELDDWTEVKLHSSFIEFSLFKRYIYAYTDSGFIMPMPTEYTLIINFR